MQVDFTSAENEVSTKLSLWQHYEVTESWVLTPIQNKTMNETERNGME